ncbi:hypothetical protein PanWU01x14_088600, partial [Parasponia andersonii]
IVKRRIKPDHFCGAMSPESAPASKNSSQLLCVTGGERDIIKQRGQQCEDHLASSYQLWVVGALDNAGKCLVGGLP